METKTEYWSNGNIKNQTDYHNGQFDGKYIVWYENGQKWTEKDYRQGQKHGKDISWDLDGQKYWEEYFLYGHQVNKEEYRKHQLIEYLSGI